MCVPTIPITEMRVNKTVCRKTTFHINISIFSRDYKRAYVSPNFSKLLKGIEVAYLPPFPSTPQTTANAFPNSQNTPNPQPPEPCKVHNLGNFSLLLEKRRKKTVSISLLTSVAEGAFRWLRWLKGLMKCWYFFFPCLGTRTSFESTVWRSE